MNGRNRVFKIRVKHLLVLLWLLAGVFPAAFLVSGRVRAAIELDYFRALTETDRIRIEWKTVTELDNAGFFVRRSLTGGPNPADYTRITVFDAITGEPYDFIPARGEDLIGAEYVFHDEDVDIGTRYYYFLEDVDSGNVSSYYGPVDAVVGQTPTPTTTAGTPGTPSATPGSPTATSGVPTSTPSRTPTRTNTPIPGFNPSATPAPSQTPTGTLLPTETPTFTESPIPPVDLTLTGIAAALTDLPTGTATATGSPPPPTPTATRTTRPSATPVDAEAAGEGLPPGRILLVIFVFLASGGLLTAGIVYLARGGPRKEDPSSRADV